MPAPVAACITLIFIAWLFRRDLRERANVTPALWLPFIWVIINGSRFVSHWLNMFGIPTPGGSLEEGSPLDRLVFIALICCAFYVLNKRSVSYERLFQKNIWLGIFLLYCFLAIFWSDYPFVSLKRWVKVLGQPLMVLIILSEPDPQEALVRLMKRCAYILVPVSILFIKYYPHWGRAYEQWTGGVMFTGITGSKNMLGADCFILGFVFLWQFVKTWRLPKSRARKKELWLCGGFLYMIWWLLDGSGSKTSLVALALGTGVLFFAGWPGVNRRLIGAYFITAAIFAFLIDQTFGVWNSVLRMLGKDPTLTERTFLWADLLRADINPLIGAGFESFWMGGRLAWITAEQGWAPNQAHNGYLEVYLNLGLIGLFLLVATLIATYRKARRDLLQNFEFGRFRLGFLVAMLVYNWTEAGFKTLHLVFFAFYIIAIDYPTARRRAKTPSRAASVPEPAGVGLATAGAGTRVGAAHFAPAV